jgi:hypothetical protein
MANRFCSNGEQILADILLGGYLHIVWQLGFLSLGVFAFIVAKLVKPPRRRRVHMTLGIFYTSGLLIGFVWGVLSITTLLHRTPFHSAHGFVAIAVIVVIVIGASLGFAIHFLKKQFFRIHFMIQFTGVMLALTQIVLGMTLLLLLSQ